MKNIRIILTLFLLITVFNFDFGYAKEKESLFEIENLAIDAINKTNLTKFDFEILKTDPSNKIEYYKIRTYCPKNINIKLNSGEESVCGKAVRLEDLDKNNFSLIYRNLNNKISKFNFKVKAYDKNGKWLETDKKSFSWK